MASYLSKAANFNPPHLHLVRPLEATPFEFFRDLQHQKDRVPGLSCGVVCVILHGAVSVEHRLVTDRETDTQRRHIPRQHGVARQKAVSTDSNIEKSRLTRHTSVSN